VRARTRRRRPGGAPPPEDSGAIAAEFAVTLPAVLLVLALGISALAAGAQSVRLQDAAADAARLAARGESPGAVERAASGGGGAAAAVQVSRREDLVCVSVSEPVRLVGIPAGGLRATGSACALDGGL
jgi:hypothetical protein